jgi:hypothetical protein
MAQQYQKQAGIRTKQVFDFQSLTSKIPLSAINIILLQSSRSGT